MAGSDYGSKIPDNFVRKNATGVLARFQDWDSFVPVQDSEGVFNRGPIGVS